MDSRDRELGMYRKISRRDFLNGVAVTAGAAMMPWDIVAAGLADGVECILELDESNLGSQFFIVIQDPWIKVISDQTRIFTVVRG